MALSSLALSEQRLNSDLLIMREKIKLKGSVIVHGIYEDVMKYLFFGDLFYDKTGGTFEVSRNNIILHFKQITDSLEISLRDSTGNIFTSKLPTPENNAANYRPSQLKIKNTRLIQHKTFVCFY